MPRLLLEEFPSIIAFRDAARNGFGDPDLAAGYARDLAVKYASNQATDTRTVNQFNAKSGAGDGLVSLLSFDEYEAGGLVKFACPGMLDRLEEEFEHEILKTGLLNKLPKPQLTFNDRGLGSFVFDRAAQTLQYRYDYFSPSLGRVVEDDEFEPLPGDPDDEPRFALLADGSEVQRRIQTQENGLPAVMTRTKKVFAYTPRHDKLSGGVELYLSAGNYGFSGDNFLYSGVVALLICKFLERAGVKVKINVVVAWINDKSYVNYRQEAGQYAANPAVAANNYRQLVANFSAPNARQDVYCGAVICAKNFNESLDRNLLALLTSDPRYWQTEGHAVCRLMSRKLRAPGTSYGLMGRVLKAVFEVENYRPEMKFKFCYGRVQQKAEVIGEITRAIEELAAFTNVNALQTQPVTPA